MKATKLIFIISTVISLLSADRIEARDFAHVFTSKGIYETCEDLWFKCLVLDDSTFRLSDKAHTAFVEIVSPADSVVWKEKYPVVNGECEGQIYIGDDWDSGEYRMYVNTRNTLGATDSLMYPTRLLVVRELPEAQNFVTARSGQSAGAAPDTVARRIRPLAVSVELDSAEYHTRSTVKAKLSVTDLNGNPVRAKIALSVYDRFYGYPASNPGLLSHCHGWMDNGSRADIDPTDIFLPDGPISGRLEARKRKTDLSPEGQFINVFDFSDTTGSLNIVETGEKGRFEVPSDMASALGWEVLLKPVSGEKMKPEIAFDDSFALIDNVRHRSADRFFPEIHSKADVSDSLESPDFSGRRVVRLEEVVVDGHAGKYPKRNKLMGTLDSISSLHGNAWVCGCPAGHGTTFLNDYIPGYTHHPIDASYRPVKRSLPVKGKSYTVVKYTGGIYHVDHLVDIKVIEYTGPRYSDEELLRMNGLWKSKGFYPDHKFEVPAVTDIGLGIADDRNTLLWMPSAETDANGELFFEINTSDIPSVFIINVVALGDEMMGDGAGRFRVGK